MDCGIPDILDTSIVTAIENKATDTTVKLIYSAGSIPLPIVPAVFLPATKAPTNTIIPNNPGISDLRSTLAPYEAEKAGAVPLPPIVIATSIAVRKGISN